MLTSFDREWWEQREGSAWPTVEQDMLSMLEAALENDVGQFSDPAVIIGGGDEAVRRGLAIRFHTFRGMGIYRITDRGREFVKKNVPPAEW